MEFKKFKSLGTGGLILAGALFTTSANAADGCKFLLCMGAPNPMGISECAGTVKEVLRDLAKGKSLPTCNLVNGLDSKTTGNYVDYNRAHYLPSCPVGLSYGSDSVYYHKGQKPTGRVTGGVKSDTYQKEYGSANTPRYTTAYRSRVCVGGQKLDAYTQNVFGGGDFKRVKHEWWEKVETVTPDNARFDFRMFVDGKLHSNHRF